MFNWKTKLEVINIKNDGWASLHDAMPSHVEASPAWNCPPLDNIVQILDGHHCTSAVVQSPYNDEDTLYDYLHDYGRAFREAGKYCARIHFFAGDPLKQTADEELDFGDLARYDARLKHKPSTKDHYLGNIVIRPTGVFCVGRTVIRRHVNDATLETNLHVRAVYETHLCGTRLRVQGVPFMQQDKSSHVCAGVALWELCYDLHRRYNTPRFFPREVTEIATNNMSEGRPIEEGLTAFEMGRMLRHLSCAVDLKFHSLKGPCAKFVLRDFVDTVYSYVHSNLPVLVGYFEENQSVGHVVLAIGHDLQETQQTPADAIPQGSTLLLRNSDFASEFLVQDDQRGPYQTLEIWRHERSKDDLNFALEDADKVFLIPGLTEDARLMYAGAHKLVRRALTPSIRARLTGVRTRLSFQRDRRFWAQLLDDNAGRSPLPVVHIEAYRRLRLPRYLWVCDLVEPDDEDPLRSFRARGEILLDATSPLYDRKSSVLAMRLGSRLHIPGREVTVAQNYEEHPWAPCNLDPPLEL